MRRRARAKEIALASLATRFMVAQPRNKLTLDRGLFQDVQRFAGWEPSIADSAVFRSMARSYGARCCDPTGPGADGAMRHVLERAAGPGRDLAADGYLRAAIAGARTADQIGELPAAVEVWEAAGAPAESVEQARALIASKVPVRRGEVLPDLTLPDRTERPAPCRTTAESRC